MKLLPRWLRKPVQLFLSLLGVWLYLLFMIKLSQSIFLITAKNMIQSGIDTLLREVHSGIVITVTIALIYLLMRAYLSPLTDENGKTLNSWYYQINGIVVLLYLVITVGAFMPLLIQMLEQ
ncbi:hypothetical protein [Breznakia pachnodae]|nr:hypothetical protein [Breznakia pachnodae]